MIIGTNHQIYFQKNNERTPYKPNFKGEINLDGMPRFYKEAYSSLLKEYLSKMFPTDTLSLSGTLVNEPGKPFGMNAIFDITMRKNGEHSVTEGFVTTYGDILELSHQTHKNLHTDLKQTSSK